MSQASSAKRGYKNITVSLTVEDWGAFMFLKSRLGGASYSDTVVLMIRELTKDAQSTND